MPTKNDLFRATFDRVHEEFFGDSRYSAEFFNYSQGDYDPSTGEIDNETRESIGTKNVEIVPPGMDTSVRQDGTSFSWDTSIRFELDTSFVDELVPLGKDNKRPTEVVLSDEVDNGTDNFELHGYSYEKGSGFVMCRLVEQ